MISYFTCQEQPETEVPPSLFSNIQLTKTYIYLCVCISVQRMPLLFHLPGSSNSDTMLGRHRTPGLAPPTLADSDRGPLALQIPPVR
jgi:hypothetical protein